MSLARIASDEGMFAIVAMDQRGTLRRIFGEVGHPDTDADMREFKRDVISGLGRSATGVLTDPEYGIPAMREFGLLDSVGLLVAAEPAVRERIDGVFWAKRDPQLNAAWVSAREGDALKYLVHLRPFRSGVGEGAFERGTEVVAEIVADCRASGVPSVIENLVYPLPGETLDPDTRADLVIEAVRAPNDLHPDLLKLEYPGSPEACRRLTAVLDVPWVVLSGGVSFDQFMESVAVACDEGGASGFIAGRSFWKEAVAMTVQARQEFLVTVARARLDQCMDVIAHRARPWAPPGTARPDGGKPL